MVRPTCTTNRIKEGMTIKSFQIYNGGNKKYQDIGKNDNLRVGGEGSTKIILRTQRHSSFFHFHWASVRTGRAVLGPLVVGLHIYKLACVS